MSHAVPFVIAAALLAFGVWRRMRQAKRARHADGGAADGTTAARPTTRAASRLASGLVPAHLGRTALVAAREVRTRVRGRFFRVVTAVILLGVGAAIVIPALAHGHRPVQRVGVVDHASAPSPAAIRALGRPFGVTIRAVLEPDVGAATRALRTGHIDVAVVGDKEVIVETAISSSDSSATAQLARALSRAIGTDRAAAAAGITPAQVGALAAAQPIPIRGLQPGRNSVALASTLIGTIIVFVMLTQYLTWTLVGVMEEKSSRVVEVLLATVRPFQLLGGKVLGIGAVALAQAGIILAFAIVVAEVVGSDVLKGATPLLLTSTFVWLILGYAFYSWVYAAAGSMAERQDQVQSLALPLSLPITAGYIVALVGASAGTPSGLLTVFAYLPPTAPFAMPVLVGMGAVAWWQFVASALLSVACTFGVARLAATVYRRAVLRTGRRVPLRELVRSR